MRGLFCLFLLVFLIQIDPLAAQGMAGEVTYSSSKNVYVKFSTTAPFSAGDTLFVQKEGEKMAAALLVSNKSSTSVVCSKLSPTDVFKAGDRIFSKKEEPKKAASKKEKAAAAPPPDSLSTLPNAPDRAAKMEDERADLPQKAAPSTRKIKPAPVRARLSVGTYSNFYEGSEARHRARYSFNLSGTNIKNSRFSTDNYLTFRQTLAGPRRDTTLADMLKIYALSVKCDLTKTSSLTLGRRINARTASVGAIDGLQFERGFGPVFSAGAVIGSRPDWANYSVNFRLMQGGFFVSRQTAAGAKRPPQQTTVGFFEQRNGAAIDRRFGYAQHTGDLVKNVNLFVSTEVDFFQKKDSATAGSAQPRLTNIFGSLRWNFSKKWSATASFDSRRNVIYYESYKNFIDQLIDDETRQGLRGGLTWRASRLVSAGGNANWRFQKSGANGSRNAHFYVNLNRIPRLKMSASLTANWLETSYLTSKMAGLRLSRDFFKGKVSLETYGRGIGYEYVYDAPPSLQWVAGGSVSIVLSRKLTFFAFAEQTFAGAGGRDFLLVNTRVMQRF